MKGEWSKTTTEHQMHSVLVLVERGSLLVARLHAELFITWKQVFGLKKIIVMKARVVWEGNHVADL